MLMFLYFARLKMCYECNLRSALQFARWKRRRQRYRFHIQKTATHRTPKFPYHKPAVWARPNIVLLSRQALPTRIDVAAGADEGCDDWSSRWEGKRWLSSRVGVSARPAVRIRLSWVVSRRYSSLLYTFVSSSHSLSIRPRRRSRSRAGPRDVHRLDSFADTRAKGGRCRRIVALRRVAVFSIETRGLVRARKKSSGINEYRQTRGACIDRDRND